MVAPIAVVLRLFLAIFLMASAEETPEPVAVKCEPMTVKHLCSEEGGTRLTHLVFQSHRLNVLCVDPCGTTIGMELQLQFESSLSADGKWDQYEGEEFKLDPTVSLSRSLIKFQLVETRDESEQFKEQLKQLREFEARQKKFNAECWDGGELSLMNQLGGLASILMFSELPRPYESFSLLPAQGLNTLNYYIPETGDFDGRNLSESDRLNLQESIKLVKQLLPLMNPKKQGQLLGFVNPNDPIHTIWISENLPDRLSHIIENLADLHRQQQATRKRLDELGGRRSKKACWRFQADGVNKEDSFATKENLLSIVKPLERLFLEQRPRLKATLSTSEDKAGEVDSSLLPNTPAIREWNTNRKLCGHGESPETKKSENITPTNELVTNAVNQFPIAERPSEARATAPLKNGFLALDIVVNKGESALNGVTWVPARSKEISSSGNLSREQTDDIINNLYKTGFRLEFESSTSKSNCTFSSPVGPIDLLVALPPSKGQGARPDDDYEFRRIQHVACDPRKPLSIVMEPKSSP